MVARKAAMFPLRLDKAILEGVIDQFEAGRRCRPGEVELRCLCGEGDNQELLKVNRRGDDDDVFHDDIAGHVLNPLLVR